MNQQLRRSFHGCLTCRRRKVRCHGGEPCQNCMRLNLDCQSSFGSNLKISVLSFSSPKSQKSSSSSSSPKISVPTTVNSQKANSHEFGNNAATTPSRIMAALEREDHGQLRSQLGETQFSVFPTTFSNTPPDTLSSPSSDHNGSTFTGFPGQESQSLQASDNSWDFEFPMGLYSDIRFPSVTQPSYDNTLLEASADQFTFVNLSGQPPPASENSVSEARKEQRRTERRANTAGEAGPASSPRKKRPRKTTDPLNLTSINPMNDIALTIPGSTADEFYFMHYNTSIRTAFSLKEDSKWNWHSFMIDFVRQSDAGSLVRTAVLAWTSKHFSSDGHFDDTSWEPYYKTASKAVQKLLRDQRALSMSEFPQSFATKSAISSAPEIIICSTLFLCRCEILNNDISSVYLRLERFRNWLSIQPTGLHLSAFGSKVLVWLSYLHVRISLFSPPQPNTTTLLETLIHRPEYHIIFSRSQLYLSETFGESYPHSELAQDTELIPISFNLHETFCLLSNMLRYRSWTYSVDTTKPEYQDLCTAKIIAMNADIRRMDAEFSLVIATNPAAAVLDFERHDESMKLDRPGLHWLTCYAAFLTAKIYWSRLLYPTARTDDVATAAVGKILQAALRLRRVPYRKVLRSMLWPLPLFVAAIETTDELYADWVLNFMDEVTTALRKAGSAAAGGGSSGGTGGEKVRLLIERVRERQRRSGRRADVVEAVREMNGDRGSFIF